MTGPNWNVEINIGQDARTVQQAMDRLEKEYSIKWIAKYLNNKVELPYRWLKLWPMKTDLFQYIIGTQLDFHKLNQYKDGSGFQRLLLNFT